MIPDNRSLRNTKPRKTDISVLFSPVARPFADLHREWHELRAQASVARSAGTVEYLARRQLTRFVMTEWQRRKLEAAFACAFSHLQNETPADDIFREVLDCAELAMGARYDVPAGDDATMRETLTVMFERFFAGDDALEIISAFRRREGLPHARN